MILIDLGVGRFCKKYLPCSSVGKHLALIRLSYLPSAAPPPPPQMSNDPFPNVGISLHVSILDHLPGQFDCLSSMDMLFRLASFKCAVIVCCRLVLILIALFTTLAILTKEN